MVSKHFLQESEDVSFISFEVSRVELQIVHNLIDIRGDLLFESGNAELLNQVREFRDLLVLLNLDSFEFVDVVLLQSTHASAFNS